MQELDVDFVEEVGKAIIGYQGVDNENIPKGLLLYGINKAMLALSVITPYYEKQIEKVRREGDV